MCCECKCLPRVQVVVVVFIELLLIGAVFLASHFVGDEHLYKAVSLAAYFWLTTALTFIAFWVDKHHAENGKFRTPEVVLHLLTFFSGLLGAWAAMCICRHKIAKKSFYLYTIFLTLLNIAWAVIGVSIFVL